MASNTTADTAAQDAIALRRGDDMPAQGKEWTSVMAEIQKKCCSGNAVYLHYKDAAVPATHQ
jgi:hypothetical protein